MADDNALELIKRGDRRWSKRQQLDSFRQEVALNFAPWHASWTSQIQWGEDFAAHLIDSTPILLARDFVSQVGSMLRPSGKQWFWHRTYSDEINSNRQYREYLDWRSQQCLRILSDRVTGSQRALKQTDEFFSLFGDGVLAVDLCKKRESLRLRAYHSKDAVWSIGHENKPDTIDRREMIPARVIKQRWPDAELDEKIKEALRKDPETEFEVRHCVLPIDEYDGYKKLRSDKTARYASVWVDVLGKCILGEAPQRTFRYVLPRWVTLPSNPYAISPATTIALPDARLIQQQALAILEAAEKQINPPLVAYSDTVIGDVRLESRGITWIDRDYDEKTGQPVRPLELGKNFNLGVDSILRTENQLTRAFYLDVLRMPDTRTSKSTVEVQFKIDEYVRAALPLFAPMQAEYNEALLHEVDEIIQLAGGYDERPIPKGLDLDSIQFQWDNPLADMLERQKAQMVAEVSQLGQAIAALEAAAAQAPALQQLDTGKMFRDSVMGIGGSAWVLDEDAAEESIAAASQQASMQQMIASAPNIAQVIDSGVNAAKTAAEIPNPAEPSYPMLPAPEAV